MQPVRLPGLGGGSSAASSGGSQPRAGAWVGRSSHEVKRVGLAWLQTGGNIYYLIYLRRYNIITLSMCNLSIQLNFKPFHTTGATTHQHDGMFWRANR